MAILGSNGEVRVVVYDSRIDAMALPGGMVFAYTKRKVGATVLKAQNNAPVRTARLRNSIRGDTRPLARGMVVGRVRATAPYSVYVHEGTTGPIEAAETDYLWVPANKGSVRRVWMAQVSGQKANPFLEDALRDTIRGRGGRRMYT